MTRPVLVFIVLLLCVGTAQATGPTLPTLPLATVNLTMPTQSGTVRNVSAGNASDLQTKINAATCGDTVVVPANNTYTGNFTIPAEGACSGWILVESSAIASLLAGTRVAPADKANMATLITGSGTSPVLSIADSAHNWRFIGLELTIKVGSSQSEIVRAGDATTVLASIPTQIIFDRCYVHGATTTSVTHGISLNAAYGAVVDSYLSNMFAPGFDSQAIVVYNGPGPYLIQNNFVSAASENSMFGGADPTIANLVPSDITVVGNWYWKDYANWLGAGYGVKNSFELKNAQRVLVDGNVFDYSWADAQTGNIVSMKSVNQGGACTWCSTTDVTFTHNIVRHGAIGVVLGLNDGTGAPQLNRILIENNVITDISSTYASGGNGFGIETQSVTNGGGLLTSNNETIDHNSIFADTMFLTLGDSGTISSYQFTNNIGTSGQYGIKGAGQASGTESLNTYVPTAVYNDNALLTADGTLGGSTYPIGTFSNTTTGAGFTNYAGANYQLTGGSPYYNAGTDGKDIGVWDWTCYNATTTAALAGNYSASQVGACYPTIGSSPSGSQAMPGTKATAGVAMQ